MRAAHIATILAASIFASLRALAAVEAVPRAVDHEPLPAAADSRATVGEPPTSSPNAHEPPHDSPLVAYAQELSEAKSRFDTRILNTAATALRAVNFEMSRHPPPRDEDCAQTLGASRFADQYEQLASIQDQLGNFEAVIQANQSALACLPRVASYEASIAAAHLRLERIDEARAAVERGHALDPEDSRVRDVRARLDFIQEHWVDATTRYRLMATENKDARSPTFNYVRCYLWLAQRRAGVHHPEVPRAVTTGPEDEYRLESWPAPILGTLRGERSEQDLVQVIRDTSRENEIRERLTEALFYVGELRLAEGDAETARRHFASVINLRVLNFVEYGMARAELKKMRDHASVAGTATPETGNPAR
jgi:tetratricopeptide (TPR) repeat protein